jgi:hypothetical protein
MILDNTASTSETIRNINKQVGKPFSFLVRIQMGGIGSHRMHIKAYSKGFESLLHRNANLLYGNIELRPEGIIIHISQRNHRFSWILPYWQMSVFQSEGFTIHGNGEFIRFHTDNLFNKNKVFLKRMFKARERIIDQN